MFDAPNSSPLKSAGAEMSRSGIWRNAARYYYSPVKMHSNISRMFFQSMCTKYGFRPFPHCLLLRLQLGGRNPHCANLIEYQNSHWLPTSFSDIIYTKTRLK